MKAKVVNIRHEMCDIYIGRPSKWGSPFTIGKDGTRDQIMRKYKEWILTQHDLLKDLEELNGKKLGCYCAPEKCHGDILIELLEEKLNNEK